MQIRSASELANLQDGLRRRDDAQQPYIAVCTGTACHAYGCLEVAEALKKELEEQGLADRIGVRETGCHGFCERGTWAVVYPEDVCYPRVRPEHAAPIVKSIIAGTVIDELLYVDPATGAKVGKAQDIAFYRRQQRLLLGANRAIDPTDLDDYLRCGGYTAAAKVLFEMQPEQVIRAVADAQLRGRGGAGFATARKWEVARNAPGDPKYVIVNCDEGDPGAYMDRSLMEGNPHAVLEGLIIGAYAIGAREGIVYVRWEYPLATRNIQVAIDQASQWGLLGSDIMGSGFDFAVTVHRGAGAFVSGEETAMLAAIEGHVGEPRIRYVYPAVRGLHGKPTVVNNVETWATVPLIMNNGPAWFASIGTERSKGTKIFSLVGKVNNTGLVEVPMGTTLRELVYEIGGGIPSGKRFKAIQIGGPSGGILSAEYLDTPIDFDELTQAGAMMGSGGIVVLDEDACVVHGVRDLIKFCSDECCGKCVPGREGLRVISGYMDDLCAGRAEAGTLDAIRQVAEVMRDASLCALGTTATNPILTSLRSFHEEYEAHIQLRRCPAKTCTDLVQYHINQKTCDSTCTACLNSCPSDGAILGRKGVKKRIDLEKCIKCGICIEVCPTRFQAVARFSGERIPSAFRTGRG